MNIALIGYGKMGKAIEEIALERGHSIVLKVNDENLEDFTKDNERYDYVFDGVGKVSFVKCKKIMKKKAVYTSSNGAINFLWVIITPLFGGKRVLFPIGKIINGLHLIKGLIEKGKFKPVIDRKYPPEKIADAFVYVASGQKIGNVIITMDD